MTKNLSKFTLSVAASAVLATSSFAYINIYTFGSDITVYRPDGTNWVIPTGHMGFDNYSNCVFATGTDAEIHLDDTGAIVLGGTNMSGSLTANIRGIGGITKEGTGLLALAGYNNAIDMSSDYTGITTVNGGILALIDGSAIPDTGVVIVNAGGTLQIDASETVGSINGVGNITLNANLTTGGNNTDDALSGVLSGAGGLIKEGSGTLTLSGSNTYSGGTTVNAGTLKGDTTSLQGSIANNATVEFAQNSNGTYTNVMSGIGALVKSSTGTLTLSGTNTYTGATAINGGTLAITGDTSTSAFSVNNGGTLAGNGTVGSTTVASGGTLAPTGTSTLNIAGDLTMNSGSALNINAYADGTNSKVSATGTATLNGGSVTVHSDSAGTWNTHTAYTILSVTGGVSGTFSGVTDDLAFLTPSLTYGANSVTLNLARDSAVTYASKGTNSYSVATGATLDNLGTPNAQMQTLLDLINGTNDTGAAQMLSQLSGAQLSSLAHMSATHIQTFSTSLQNRMNGALGGSGGIGLASLAFADNSSMAQTFQYLADAGAVGPNGFVEPQKIADNDMWIRAVGGRTTTKGDASKNLSDATTTTGGLQMGVDKRMDEWIVGASLGYLHSNNEQTGIDGKVDSYQLGVYTAYDAQNYRLSFDVIGGKYNNKSSRTTPTGTADATFDGTALSAELKAAYKISLDKTWSLEPSIGGWTQRYAQNGYTESGAVGSNLSIDQQTFTTQALTTELKFINTFGNSKTNKGTFETAVGYDKESGDINAPLVGRFSAAPTAGNFSIASANRGSDVLTAMIGGNFTVATNTRLFGLINGNYRENENGYSAMAGVKIDF